MGHPQLPTSITTDNSTAAGYVNGNIQTKKSKSWDMRLHWLRDEHNEQFFNVNWAKGDSNKADYFTKHHSTIHHRKHRPQYVYDSFKVMENKLNSMCKTSQY